MSAAFPGESVEYTQAHDRLLEQEVELRRSMEAVAAARRRLPRGWSRPRGLRVPGHGTGPSCTMLDLLDGAADHVSARVNLVAVAKAPLPRILTFARERGWRRLRLLSSLRNTYNRDYLAQTQDGSQMPILNVFQRDGADITHFWGAELLYAPAEPGQDARHVGTIEPLWNIFDLTPEGRGGDFEEQLSY